MNDDPTLHVVEVCWQLADERGRIATCIIGQVRGLGLMVRAGYNHQEVFRLGRASDVNNARHLAEIWRTAALARGFAAVSSSNPSEQTASQGEDSWAVIEFESDPCSGRSSAS